MPTQQNQHSVSVFISYAHEDEPLLRRLETHLTLLKRQGLISIWHDRQILPGTSWAGIIDQQLEQASIILLLISPDFLASDYCYEIEMALALERHEAGQARVIPIALRPADWHDAPFAHIQALPTDAQPITTSSNQDVAFVDVAAGIRRAIEDLALLPASATRAALPALWNVPYPRNPFFTGREDLLARLHTQLQSRRPTLPTALAQSPQAISGLGGIGKTQLATEYAYLHAQDYDAIFWARADTLEALIASYSEIAALLKLPESRAGQQEITTAAVKAWLQANRTYLLILDNADDLTLLPPFLPTAPGGHILITTRAWDMQRLATRLEVPTLPAEQGATFLLRRASLLLPNVEFAQASPKDRQMAIQLTQALGGLPLALDQAGAYLEATGMSMQDYLRAYQTRRLALLQERRSLVPDHPEAVTVTWSLSFERIEHKNLAAIALLQLCAYLAPDAIPEDIITKGAEHLGPQLQPIAADPLLFAQAIEALRAYSLIERDPQTRTLSVHRLVQAIVGDRVPPEGAHEWKRRVVQAVNAARPDVTDITQWEACEQWLPHALMCATWIEQEQMYDPDAARLLNQAGYYLNQRVRYPEAEPLMKRVLAIREEKLGREHPDIALGLNNLAQLYDNQGKYVEAEPLMKRVLEIYEEKSGGKHLDTARSLNNLALLYYKQGKYAEAEPLYKRALTIHEEQLGGKHPDTALSLNNLAQLYDDQGRYAEAEPLYKRTLAIYEGKLGREHPDIARSLNNLATLYYNQGKYGEAEPLYKRALVIYEQKLGQDHPATQTCRKNYAILLRAMGREL